MNRPLERIRELIRLGRYEVSGHALDEAADDEFDVVDIETAILTGILVRTETDDPRGTKYVVQGSAADLIRQVGVVARFTSSESCVIITVYEVQEA